MLCAGFLLDLLLGDPHWLYHPVQAIGKVIEYTEKAFRKVFCPGSGREEDRGKKRAAGAVLVVVVLLISMGVSGLLLSFAGYIHPYIKTSVSVLICYQMLAVKSLKTESMKVYYALKSGSLLDARLAVSMIVGRDTKRLSKEGVTRAAVETVAENTSDGVVAPLFYMFLFGPLGGVAYKTVNTMDSMIGYKNDKYCYFGTAAARLDDFANYVPARAAALAMAAAAFLLGYDGKGAVRIYKRDRYKHASPNSAQTEAVCAGALGVRLAGDAYYFGKLYHKPAIGDADREIEPEDIVRANRLLYAASVIVLLAGLAVCTVLVCAGGLWGR